MGCRALNQRNGGAQFPLIIFLIGMASLLIGVTFAAIEIRRSFSNILAEVKSEE
jgi:hypothetical protein